MSFFTPTGIIPLYRNIDTLERSLNVAGYVPVLGSISGKVVRGTLATAEIVAGIVLAFFHAFISFGNPMSAFYATTSLVFLKHGILNSIRSFIEIRPFASLIVCLPFDLLLGRVFPYPV